jgi:TonB family protein
VLSPEDLLTLGADVVLPGEVHASGGSSSTNISMGAAEVQGAGLSPEVVRRVVRRHMNEVRFCYEQGLARAPGLAGALTVHFEVSPTGAVTDARAVGALGDAAVGACVGSAHRRWTFPPPDGGSVVRVQYPVTFSVAPPSAGRGFGLGFGLRAGSPLSDFVLTRLHYRYGKDKLGDDLVLRPAPPVVGGREQLADDGRLERGATPAASNSFQGRYVIRHPWQGAIACDDPMRGVWGGPPDGREVAHVGQGQGGIAAGGARALAH